MKPTASLAILCGGALCLLAQAQSVTVTATALPDESMSQAYMAHDKDCRSLIKQHGDPTETSAACKSLADEADAFSPQSHFLTRREAYVYYTIALVQAKKAQLAIEVGNKAVAIVLLGHDDASGCGAAYSVRGQAKAFAGDLAGSSQDLETAETYQRNGINSPAGQALKTEYSKTLKGTLTFHAEVLTAMGDKDAADTKLELASKL